MARWTVAGLLMGIVLFWPAIAEAQKKKNKKAKDPVAEASATEYALLRAQSGAFGKLGSINSTSKAFMLQIGAPDSAETKGSTAAVDPTLAEFRSQIKLENLWQQQQRLLAAKSPREMAKRLQQLRSAQRQLAIAEVQRQSRLFQKANKVSAGGKSNGAKGASAGASTTGGNGMKGPYKQFELEATDKAVVRLGYLPVRYDDKGGIMEYTPREIEKLRGDKTKPGLAATFADLQAGQVVRVYFAKPKAAKPAAKQADPKKADAKNANVKKAKDEEVEGESPARPQVSMILILSEANDPMPPEAKKRKKKN